MSDYAGIDRVRMAGELEYIWPEVSTWIQQSIDEGFDSFSLDYVWASVSTGENTLWLVRDEADEIVGVAVSMFEILPNTKKVLGILAAGGDGAIKYLDQWQKLLDILDAFGSANGASELRLVGRPAFKKLFANSGFEHRYTVLGRNIERRN